jgi:hypothetical protein
VRKNRIVDTKRQEFTSGYKAAAHLFTLTLLLVTVLATLSLDSTPSRVSAQSTVALTSIAPLPNTLGEQRTLVMLVNFQDNTAQPYTVDQARNLVFGTVNNFFYENSYQQVWLTGDIYGWFTIPISSTSCNTGSISSYANAAAVAAGADLSTYSRFVYIFPRNSCGFNGYTTQSDNNPPQAFINGSMTLGTVSHELGHTFGLNHAQALDCGLVSIGSNCTTISYGDKFDTMGGSTGDFNAYNKERLGWLNYGLSPAIATVESSGTYFVEPLETLSSGGPKALKILKSIDPTTGDKTWYYVEFRQPLGFDAALSGNGNVTNGVLIHQATQYSSPINLFQSLLLDMTPETSSWSDPALPVGRNFQDTNAGFTLTLLSVSGSGCAVFVDFSSSQATCTPLNPSISMTPSQPAAVQSGMPVTYNVTVANNDSSVCSAGTFNLHATIPTGWSASFASPSVTLVPGGSASTTLTVWSPKTAMSGTYSAGVSATNNAGSAYSCSASATYSIAPTVASLTVGISTDRSSYTINQTVATRGIVLLDSAPVQGATVSFAVTKSNGSIVTLKGTTGADGSATVKYRVSKQDPRGTYQDKASSNINGLSGSATTNFVVQ